MGYNYGFIKEDVVRLKTYDINVGTSGFTLRVGCLILIILSIQPILILSGF